MDILQEFKISPHTYRFVSIHFRKLAFPLFEMCAHSSRPLNIISVANLLVSLDVPLSSDCCDCIMDVVGLAGKADIYMELTGLSKSATFISIPLRSVMWKHCSTLPRNKLNTQAFSLLLLQRHDARALEIYDLLTANDLSLVYSLVEVDYALHLFAKFNRLNDWIKLFDNAVSGDVRFSFSDESFGRYVYLLIDGGYLLEAIRVYETCLTKYKIAVTPSQTAFDLLLRKVFNAKDITPSDSSVLESEETVLQIRRKNIAPQLSPGALLSIDLTKAISLFRLSQSKGIALDKSIYKLMINLCAEGRVPDLAMKIFQEAVDTGSSAFPEATTLNALIRAYSRTKDPVSMLRAYDYAVLHNVERNFATCMLMCSVFFDNGYIFEAIKHWRQEQPPQSSFRLLQLNLHPNCIDLHHLSVLCAKLAVFSFLLDVRQKLRSSLAGKNQTVCTTRNIVANKKLDTFIYETTLPLQEDEYTRLITHGLQFITGRGVRSPRNVPKIKPAVIQLLTEDISPPLCILNTKTSFNPGVVEVSGDMLLEWAMKVAPISYGGLHDDYQHR